MKKFLLSLLITVITLVCLSCNQNVEEKSVWKPKFEIGQIVNLILTDEKAQVVKISLFWGERLGSGPYCIKTTKSIKPCDPGFWGGCTALYGTIWVADYEIEP
jgi:hypothetical protein